MSNLECHENTCDRNSFRATSCDCGFTQRLIRGEVNVTSANRGRGGCGRYAVVIVPNPDAAHQHYVEVSEVIAKYTRERCKLVDSLKE